jgi:hypothetical protein
MLVKVVPLLCCRNTPIVGLIAKFKTRGQRQDFRGGEQGSVADVDTFFVPLTALPQVAADYGPFGWCELIHVKAAHCKYLFE